MSPAVTPGGAPGEDHPAVDERDRSARHRLLALEAILEQSDLNVTIFDRDYIVRDVSRFAAALSGRSREGMRGRSLLEELPPARHENLARTLAGESIHEQGTLLHECGEGGEEDGWAQLTTLPLHDEAGDVQGGVLIAGDILRQKHAEELIGKLALIDAVTELPNRTMLSMLLSRALAGVKGRQRQLALVWLNLDRFKDVNDALGQQVGDELLHAVGERLHEVVRIIDVVARIGGDEFVLLLPRVNSRQHLEHLAERVHEVFATPYDIGGESVLLSASCGIAVHPAGAADAQQLQQSAHNAMRAAKELGGGCEVFDPGRAEEGFVRLWLAREIRDGIEQGRFVLYYQPQVNLGTMRVQAVEALARWNHPERGLVSPAEFIPFAEENGLIVSLGRRLLAEACDHLRGWHASLESAPRLAINVSAREVQRSDVSGEVKRTAANAKLNPSLLEIEFTETVALAHPERTAEVAASLRAIGATVVLDDFGTGFSSLTHLRELPIDRVKIDRSFVASCLEDRSAAAILVAITHLAHDLHKEVVAEGVETSAQLEFVKAVGCDAAQGYRLARPLPHRDCTEYLRRAAEGLAA